MGRARLYKMFIAFGPGVWYTCSVETEVIRMRWNKKWNKLALCALLVLLLPACGAPGAARDPEPAYSGPTVSVGGQTVAVDESMEQSTFTEADFSLDETTGRVTCLSRQALTGIDVSSHQGEIDWAAVAGDGISFAILRIGNRGYSEGVISADQRFEANLAGAQENGLQVGCYFFSQAVSVEEAQEEADFVLAALNGREMDLPVVFDWEHIDNAEARTDSVDTETVTACARAFCERIQEAGYQTAVYCNGMLGYLHYDLSQLEQYDAWYAEYASWPSFAYAFDLWQYTNTGTVAGIAGNVDLDLWFPPQTEG